MCSNFLIATRYHKNNLMYQSGLLQLPNEVLYNIAGLLPPPDVYSLIKAMPSDFAVQPTDLPDKLETMSDLEAISTNVTLADALLFTSQFHGMVDVLHNGMAKLSYKDIAKIIHLQKDLQETNQSSLLLSGSSMVQAMTGLRFKDSDLDFYVTTTGLQAVRRLLKELGYVCHKVSPSYQLASFQDNYEGIHHVETYVLAAGNIKTATALKLTRRWKRSLTIPTAQQGNPLHSRRNRNRGKNITKLLGKCAFEWDDLFTHNANTNHKKVCDIVVTRDRTTPQDTIGLFDLDICKSYFDGTKIYNPNGEKTFFKATGWQENWGVLINSYMPLFLPHREPTTQVSPTVLIPNQNLSDLQKLMIVMHSISHAFVVDKTSVPCALHGFNCNCVDHEFDNNYYRYLHLNIMKRFKRMVKYTERGISMPLKSDIIDLYLSSKQASRPATEKGQQVAGDIVDNNETNSNNNVIHNGETAIMATFSGPR